MIAIVLAIDDGMPLQARAVPARRLVVRGQRLRGVVAPAGEPRRRADGRDRADLVRLASCCAGWPEPLPLTAGIWLGDLWLLPLAFLLAGFPLGRLHGTLDRVLIGALALVMIPLEFLWLLFLNFDVLRRRAVPTTC